ncbi:zinc ribbon domain-containing protein [Amycolatopsis sp. NPDC001319]|uniref:zinc ribbon domain-containing protein n=1 Tax=unclassified Amycolatopsis TaxID=2618356 RepID=UPI0036B907A5
MKLAYWRDPLSGLLHCGVCGGRMQRKHERPSTRRLRRKTTSADRDRARSALRELR